MDSLRWLSLYRLGASSLLRVGEVLMAATGLREGYVIALLYIRVGRGRSSIIGTHGGESGGQGGDTGWKQFLRRE